MIKVDTKVNVADLGTKILDKFTFQKLRGMLMFDMEGLFMPLGPTGTVLSRTPAHQV